MLQSLFRLVPLNLRRVRFGILNSLEAVAEVMADRRTLRVGLVVVIGIIILLIGLNAFYVAAEFASISARRSRVEALAEAGSGGAKRLLPYLGDADKLDRYISASQIGITLTSLAVGFYGQAQLTPYVGLGLSSGLTAALVLIFLSALQVIFSELVPKSIAMRYPERLGVLTALPMVGSLFVLRPLIALFNGSALLLLKLFGVERGSETHAHSPDELELVFRESAQGGFLDMDEREMLENVLQFETRLARQIMVPRNRMVTAELSDDPAALLARRVETPHMSVPVYDGTIDKVFGVLNLKDLFGHVRQHSGAQGGGLRTILRDVPILPETNTVSEVWDVLKSQQNHLAVLFDEYGGTVGMVTLEDIIEEIVGEVQDEFDHERVRLETRDGTVYVRGDVLVSVINRQFLLTLPQDEADTMGGLVFEELERSPSVGDTVHSGAVTLTVTAVDDNAVTEVSFVAPDKPKGEQEPGEQKKVGQPDSSPSLENPQTENSPTEDTVTKDTVTKDTVTKDTA
ncbi:hemolysin family protein [soil metagenome]